MFIISKLNMIIMKPKLLFILLLSLFPVFSHAQVIFDPATYPQDSLPSGMTIDSIDGKVYVRVILDGWNSYIKINPSVAVDQKATHYRTVAKLGTGVSGSELSNIKTFLKLTDSVYTDLGNATFTSSDTLVHYQVSVAKAGKVGYIQVAGQDITAGWNPVVGDTLWLGKVTAVEVDPQAIFDPNTYDPEDLPEGMTIVDLDGVKYLQVILNGVDSYLDILPYTISSDYTDIRTKTKYHVGSSGFSMSKIGIGVYLYDAAHMVLADATLNTPPKPDLTVYMAAVEPGTATRLRVYAVGKPAFTPIVGDTMWIGKVRAVTVEKGVVFDPAQYDPSELAAGMEIVNIGGTKYLKAPLNGWDNYVAIDPINVSLASTHFTTNAKYQVGTSGFTLDKIKTFLKLTTADATELGAAGNTSSAEFTKYSVPFTATGIVGNFQFAGQETVNWGAVTGDTIWIGKMYLEDKTAPSIPGNLVAALDGSTVTLTWDASTDNNSVKGYEISQDDVVLDTVTAKTFEVADLALGTYTFKVVAIDRSGNRSGFAAAEVTIMETGIHNQQAEKLTVYPNPVSSTLSVNRIQGVLEMNVLNLTGSVVKTVHNTNTMDVSDLREGLYLIKVKTSSGIYSGTFIKE
jgi:hypothetical protein